MDSGSFELDVGDGYALVLRDASTDYLVQGFAAGMQLPLVIRCGAALVGSVGVRFDDSRRTAEIGYWSAREHEGRGVVTRSVRALVDWLLSEHETERIELRCARTNGRSRAVAERLGFTLDEGGVDDAAPPLSTQPRHDLVTYRFG